MKKAMPARRAAETVTLVISIVLLLSVAILLLNMALKEQSQYVEISANLELEAVRPSGSGFIVPVAIENKGEVSASKVRLVVTSPKLKESRFVDLDYLGQGALTRVYLMVNFDPRGSEIAVAPTYYELD